MSGIRHYKFIIGKDMDAPGAGGRELVCAPACNAGAIMAEPILEYRIWQRGAEWHWQVMSNLKDVLASGIANSSAAARIAAFNYCHESQGDHTEPD